MPFGLWLTLLAACLIISLTPGAGAINTMGNSLAYGLRRAIWGILGQQAALVVHIVVVAAGVGVLVASSPVLFEAIRYAGAAYLVYLGIRQLLPPRPGAPSEADDTATAADTDTAPTTPESRWSMFRRGLWVNLLNPKAIVFFLAFLPQFIRPDRPVLPQYLTVTVTVIVVDIVVMWGVFAVAAHGMRRLTRSPRGRRILDGVFGALFIGVAGLLVFVH